MLPAQYLHWHHPKNQQPKHVENEKLGTRGFSMKSFKYVAPSIFALSAIASPAWAESTLIYAGKVVTEAGKPTAGPSSILVTDGKIISITPGRSPVPADTKLIDLGTATLAPGLIDLHVHLSSDPGGDYRSEAVDPDEWGVVIGTKNARLSLLSGFTTVRDLGSAPQVGFVLRRGTAEGKIIGPRIISSGPAISIIGGHGDVSGFRPDVNAALDGNNTCTGAEQCAARVRQFAKAGADVIKITATGGVLSQQARGLDLHFTPDEMASIVKTAHGLGLKVAAHAHGPRGIEAAARAGVDTIEHGTFADAAALKAMKDNGTVMVPTLMAFTGIRERLGKGIYTPQVEAKVRATLSEVGKAGKSARSQGITVAFGTDSGVFEHGRNAEEFQTYVDLFGMTPAEALASGTHVAAKVLGMDAEIGRIAPGLSADMIATDIDPQTDARALQNIRWVMVRGRVAE
jgi:imidazolonepropionase-like amidohydrolase